MRSLATFSAAGTWSVLTLSGCSQLVDTSPLGCVPHRLCDDGRSICVAAGEEPECRPLLDTARGCDRTYPPISELDSLRDFDLLHVGLIAAQPTEVDSSSYGVPTTKGVAAAVRMMNRHELPVQAGPSRKLLVVACHEAAINDDETKTQGRSYLKSRVEHLAGKLRVPVIIGASSSGATKPINTQYLSEFDTLLLSPSATEDAITAELRDGRQLFWRTVPPDGRQIPALLAALERAQAAVGTPAGSQGKVAAIYDESNAAGLGLFRLLFSNPNVEGVEGVEYTRLDESSRAEAISRTIKLKPRFILPFGTDGFVQDMLAPLEERWPADTPRPWYIMSEGNRADFAKALAAPTGSSLVERVIGTAPGARSEERYKQFELDSKPEFEDDPEPGNLAECGYDAAYLVAYAATKASLRQRWPGGPDLVEAIATMSCKQNPTQLRVADSWFRADVGKLLLDPKNNCYDLLGASGALDYEREELAGGSRELSLASSNMALWCLGDPTHPNNQTRNLRRHYYDQKNGIQGKEGSSELALDKLGWCADET